MAASASLTLAAMATFVAAFCGCSSDSHVAGNSAETGSPELAGILLLENGNPAAYARVQCVPQNFDAKAGNVLPTAFTTEANADGAYSLNSIPTGTYAVEAYHEESGKRLLVQNVKVSEDSLFAVSDTLRDPGFVKFEYVRDLEEGAIGVATVLGTTIHRNVVVHGQTFVIDSLPAGKLDLQVFFNEDLGEKPWMQGPIDVVPGDTETILLTRSIPDEPDIVIPHDSVSLTFVAPLALPEGADTLNSVVTDIPIALRLTESNCNFDSLKYANHGHWEAVRISKDGTRSKKLPITFTSYRYLKDPKFVLWVRVDSLNVGDSLEVTYDGLGNFVYALDVFPTNRSYSLVWHFGNPLSPMTDYSEYGYFDGEILGNIGVNAMIDGVVGGGVRMDTSGAFYVRNSAEPDTLYKVNLSYGGDEYFCFSVWLQLDALDKEQTIVKKLDEYMLRYVPEQGFVVDLRATDSATYKYSWSSGTSGIKAGEWIYLAFSRHVNSQTVFFVNDNKIESEPERVAWEDERAMREFRVGGFTGKIDELMLGGCFRDETWTRLTYLNQKPTDYWPVLKLRE